MEKVNCVSLFVLVVLQVVTADIRNVRMDGNDNCGYSYTVLQEDYGTILVHWVGRPVDEGCTLRFNVDSDIDEACVVATTQVMPECRQKIRFYRGYDSTYKQELDCYSGEFKFCSEGKSKILLKFHNADSLTASNVTLKVYGISDDDDDDDDYYYLIRPIATGAGVVLVLIGIAIGWCVFLKISRRKERQRKEMLATNPPKTWAQQAQEQQAQGYTYNTQQNAMYPVAQPSAPPPSYGKPY
ncbi:uncharacterized protein LOC110458151 [Mizuhopecten yessoensis]|uniref:CUB domain-containing protein n=1 Tax=Mizuhopecten yessoensis TaxID=6573 RepID=A0A210Q7C7_MIZYE|nr:uncharacterized protein LOC110458151 [Mizuhopecten yessoensis]XP_021365417.1 uncharacterized protein LOC110458151 [Mizuhopecten yessoensis]XP_021365418.1 uncharacterized protein LOC110458151 [Mizuhopecten yessoensis]XP_021365419.1 uncharacterized protein LOC110458151 [Mizuhopecten yessoensis]OWF44599.1 hypothetical protein KP79_PYT12088 [Mizuhopecten yessoensis]